MYDESENESGLRMGNVEAIIGMVEQGAKHEVIEGVPDVVIIPSPQGGKELRDLREILDKRLERPRRASGTSMHTTLDSIIAHANRQKIDRSVIFASDDPARPFLVVVYNYDDKPVSTSERADYRDHRAHYAFPLSEEWQAWARASGDKWLSQADFAELLEARILDVLDPASVPPASKETAEKLGLVLATPAALMTCARGVAINASQSVTQALNLSTGETEIVYAEKHEGKGGAHVIVPGAFALKLPVFRGGAPYVVLARLRYRMNGGQVVWGVRLHRSDLCFRAAFDEACERAAKETSLPLFYGSSES